MFEDKSEKIERAKAGLTKRELLLKGELHAEGVRKMMGLELRGGYPAFNELPDRFSLPGEITQRVASITAETGKDKKEREFFVGLLEGKYSIGKVHIGTDSRITHDQRHLFPSRLPEYVLMEIHTHRSLGEGRLATPSPTDIASFLVTFQHVPAMLIASQTGAWALFKGKEFYQQVGKVSEDLFGAEAEIRSFVERSEENYKLSVGIPYPAGWESLYTSILQRYGVVFYSSNPNYLQALHLGPRPILGPKQKVEMVRISGETHKKFLAD